MTTVTIHFPSVRYLIKFQCVIYSVFFSHSRAVQHLDIIRVFYSPTDAQENCSKKNIKIDIKAAPTYFGLITIIRERIIRAC
jgi:hypothetical protein